jgi:hypothetical protein
MEGKELTTKINTEVIKNDLEVIMPYVKEIFDKFVERDIQINKTETESKERLSMRSMALWHRERLIVFGIIIAIAIVGGISGIKMLLSGRTEIGFPIISATISGILGLLGGKSLAK